MSKKRILFVMNNLNVGGAEKALVSLLNELDYSRLEVDLLLFKQEGVFLKEVPKEVNILPEPKNYRFFDGPFAAVLKTFNPKLIFARYWFKKLMQKGKNRAEAEQYSWKALRLALSKLPKGYDVAIGYLEKNPNYFVVDKVTAKKKIGYVLNDYNALGMCSKMDTPFFEKLNNIVTDSIQSNDTLSSVFPQFEHKILTIHNLINKNELIKKSAEEIDFPKEIQDKKVIISVGRLTYQKGYDISYEAMKILLAKHHDIHWVVVGDGEERDVLKRKTAEDGMEDKITFLGVLPNPYPLMKKAFLFLHTARFEGYGIIVKEAALLHLPMVLTNFNTATQIISPETTGLIAEMNSESVFIQMERLISNQTLRRKLIENLEKEASQQVNEMDKFYRLIEI